MNADSRVREVNTADAPAVAAIYNHYIDHTVVTFEESHVDAADIERRIDTCARAGLPWLVVEADDELAGYAYASEWSGRCAYRYSVETTVYLHPSFTGRGLGKLIYAELFERLRGAGMHVAIGGISLPNEASVALHESFGMEKVAHFAEVGYKFGRWVDVGYWQRVL